MKDRYLIKVTYLDGPHANRCYLLRKGGHVTYADEYQILTDYTYSSLGFANAACRRLKDLNTRDFDFERNENRYYVKKGLVEPKKDNQWIYWHENYEPIRCDPETAKVDTSTLTSEEIRDLSAPCW